MKLMIASDLHGSFEWTKKLVDKFHEEKCDNLLLLGDLLYHGPRNALPNEYDTIKTADLLNSIKDKIMAVRGNCDSEVDEMVLSFDIKERSMMLYIDGVQFFATHGHIYNEDYLPSFQQFDVLLNGHTHTTTFNRHKDYVFVNPGSTSIPKNDTYHSLAIYEDRTFYFYDLEDGLLTRKEKI